MSEGVPRAPDEGGQIGLRGQLFSKKVFLLMLIFKKRSVRSRFEGSDYKNRDDGSCPYFN